MTSKPRRAAIRRDAGTYGYERALTHRGLGPVAGVDEAGRGACAGPLVAAAVILSGQIPGLTDSKLLSPQRRDELSRQIYRRATSVAVAAIDPAECDRLGMHRANIAGLRRAIARLNHPPGYVLTDGFAVDGCGVPTLAVPKGDRISASISAASIVAKVTRDRHMHELHEQYPAYNFAAHKGYVTQAHQQALAEHGPCAEHRKSYNNVQRETL